MANVPHVVYEYSICSHQAINSAEHREYELLNPITLGEQLSTARETINSAMKRLCNIVNILQIRVQTVKNTQFVTLIVTLLYLSQRSVGKQIEELCH
jgi:hypothetical protein